MLKTVKTTAEYLQAGDIIRWVDTSAENEHVLAVIKTIERYTDNPDSEFYFPFDGFDVEVIPLNLINYGIPEDEFDDTREFRTKMLYRTDDEAFVVGHMALEALGHLDPTLMPPEPVRVRILATPWDGIGPVPSEF